MPERELCAVCGLEVRLARVKMRDLPATAWLHQLEPAGHAAVLGTRAPEGVVAQARRQEQEAKPAILAIPEPTVRARISKDDLEPARARSLANLLHERRWVYRCSLSVGPWLDSKGGFAPDTELVQVAGYARPGPSQFGAPWIAATWIKRPDLKDADWKFHDALGHPGGDLIAGALGGNDLTTFVKEHSP